VTEVYKASDYARIVGSGVAPKPRPKPRKRPQRDPVTQEGLLTTGEWLFTVDVGGRPVSLNSERAKHWTARNSATKEWLQAAGWAVTETGLHQLRLARAEFTFQPVYAGGNLPDTANIYPTEKAIVDAVVALGVIADDNRFHNAAHHSLAPVLGDSYRVEVTVTAVGGVVGHDACVCQPASR